MSEKALPRVLTVAGSDSGGGAGIQADLKTFTALGTYGMSVVTALTAQNTVGVNGIHAIPADFVGQQLDAVLGDIGADAVKTGMLANAEVIDVVAERLEDAAIEYIVVDPVMVAGSGDRLLEENAVCVLRERLFPLAYVVTPNVPEAELLTGLQCANTDDMRTVAQGIAVMGPKYVLIKGGHLPGEVVIDMLFDGVSFHEFRAARIPTRGAHGTGCTLAAALAAYLARGDDPVRSVESAKEYLAEAIRSAPNFGLGADPLNHMWDLER